MVLGLSIWVVTGLVLTAALLSSLYVIWLEHMWNYEKVEVPSNGIKVLKDINGQGNKMYLIVYVSKTPRVGRELEEELEEGVNKQYPGYHITPIKVSTEPGFNSFRILDKQKNWAMTAVSTWTSSFFHALVAPIDIMLRWHFFPIWTMIDFVSHERHVAAAVISEEEGDFVESDLKFIMVESYSGLYIKATNGAGSH